MERGDGKRVERRQCLGEGKEYRKGRDGKKD